MLVFLLGAVFIGLLPGRADAHGGLALAKDQCKLSLGKYWMHFTGYQPDTAGSKEFCEDVPEIGHTVVALDATDPELRAMPIEVRVVRDTGDMSNLDAITILHVTPRVYSAGSVTFEYTFDKPGKFIGIVTATDDKEPLVSQFPFSVGSGNSILVKYMPFAGIILAGALFYWYSAVRRKKAVSPGQSATGA